MFETIRKHNRYRRQHAVWQKKYDLQAPRVGEMSIDFDLFDVSGEHRIQLSDFRGYKPVALIFGSFTWPPYVRGTVCLRDIFKEFQGRVQFLSIYIREAHPVDGWWLGADILGKIMKRLVPKVAVDVYDPQSIEERRVVAGRCEDSLQYGVQTYVDEMDDPVSKAYAVMPTRLYLVSQDGRVVYQGGLGPYGFKPAELKEAIDNYLALPEQKLHAHQTRAAIF